MSWLQTLAGAQNSSGIPNPIKQNANGTWSVPDTFMAGNRWSNANINADWAKQFGGTYTANNQPKMTYVQNRAGMSGGYWVPTSGGDAGTQPGTWNFNQDPTQYISSGEGATFVPGQGQNNSWKSAIKEIAPIAGIAAAPFLAAGVTGMANGGTFAGGIGGMSGMGSAGVGGGTINSGIGIGSGGFSSGAGLGTIPIAANAAPAAAGAGVSAGTAAAGGAAAGGGLLSNSIPSMAGSATMGGSGIGAAGGTGFGAGGLTSAAAGGAGAAGSGGLGSWLGNVGSNLGNQITNNPLGVLAGGTQSIMQYLQGKNLEDIAKTSSDKANALNDPQRQAYQQLLGQYYFGGQDITQQPMYQAAMRLSTDQNQAKLAAQGLSGSGRAITSANENAANVFNSTAQPYLNSLSGIAGYGFGPGQSGQLYQNGMTQASGANTQAIGSLFNAFTSPQPSQTPWYQHANYAQNQMTQVPGGGMYAPQQGT